MLLSVLPCQIAAAIPQSQRERVFAVLSRDSHALVARADVNETLRLADRNMVSAVANKHGFIRHLVAEVSGHAIRRMLRDVRIPPFNPHAISHIKQAPGAQRWVARPDMAHCGLMGSVSRSLSPFSASRTYK